MSNVYLAVGQIDNRRVMKVGKTGRLANRARELGVEIIRAIPCDSDRTAFEFETMLRKEIEKYGGKHTPSGKDWFEYEENVLALVNLYIDRILYFGYELKRCDDKIAELELRITQKETDYNARIAYLEGQIAAIQYIGKMLNGSGHPAPADAEHTP